MQVVATVLTSSYSRVQVLQFLQLGSMHIHSICAVALAMAFLLPGYAATSRVEDYPDWPKILKELTMQEQELQVEKQQSSKPWG